MKLLQRVASATAERLGRRSPVIKVLQPLYEATLRVLSGGRGLRWSVNGIPCRIDVGQRAGVPREYEPEVARFLGERVRTGALSLNVGANVGVYVLQFAHWSRPGGRVFAFEPNPAARAVLERHILFNGLEGRVEVVPYAVGSADGRAILFSAGEAGMSRLGVPSPMLADRANRNDVAVTTVDRFCGSRGVSPDWLFIDIEGLEAAALEGARSTIAAHPGLEVVVEFHPSAWPVSQTNADEVRRLLGGLGMTPVPLTGQRDPLADHGVVHLRRG